MLPYYAVKRWIVVLKAKVAPLLDCTYFAKKREFELPFFRGVTYAIHAHGAGLLEHYMVMSGATDELNTIDCITGS